MKIPSQASEEGGLKNEAPASDFSEYMWMENEEEFEEEVMKQLEEEALMEQCIEAMLEDELENNENMIASLANIHLEDKTEIVNKSTLNPNAAEFIPFTGTEASEKKGNSAAAETSAEENDKEPTTTKDEPAESPTSDKDLPSSNNGSVEVSC